MDLEKIISVTGIPRSTVAKSLFPDHKYPDHAIKNFSKAKRGLTQRQMEALYFLTGLSMQQLEAISSLSSGAPTENKGWAWYPKKDKIKLKKGEYRVDYFPDLNVGYLYKNSIMIGSHLLVSGTTPLSEFISDIEELIHLYELSLKQK